MQQTVLLIEGGLGAGGGQRTFLALVESFRRNGWKVSVLVSQSSFIHAQLLAEDMEVLLVKSMPRGPGIGGRIYRNAVHLLALWKARASMRLSNLVVVNDPDFFIPSAFLAFFLGLSNLILFAHLVYGRLQRLVFRCVSQLPSVCAIWCPSEFLRLHLYPQQTSSPIQCVLPPLCRFPLRAVTLFEEDWTFASVGLLHPDKGHDVILMLAKELPERAFYIIGPDHLSDLAYAQSLRANAPANVIFPGFVHDLAAYFDQHHIRGIVAASRNNNEAFGLVAAEAVAQAQMCVVRDTGGLSEIAKHLGLPQAQNDHELISLMKKLLAHSDHQADIRAQQEKWKLLYSPSAFDKSLRQHTQAALDWPSASRNKT